MDFFILFILRHFPGLCIMSKSKDDKYTNHQANIPLASFSPFRNVIADESVLIRNFRARSICSTSVALELQLVTPICGLDTGAELHQGTY